MFNLPAITELHSKKTEVRVGCALPRKNPDFGGQLLARIDAIESGDPKPELKLELALASKEYKNALLDEERKRIAAVRKEHFDNKSLEVLHGVNVTFTLNSVYSY